MRGTKTGSLRERVDGTTPKPNKALQLTPRRAAELERSAAEGNRVEPRQHHVQMKYLLAQMAIQNPARFFATFGPGGDAAYLADLWDAIGQDLPDDQQVPSAGAAVWHGAAGGLPAVVLTLPPPAARNEAYLVGAVRPPDGGCRVFCLERAVMPSTGEEFAILSELAAGGRSN